MTAMDRVRDHLKEATERYDMKNIVAVSLQGSQNYGLDYEGSDVDTKLILTPSLRDICLNKKPISTTHIRANEEHTDDKDVRLYMETFRKQNLNFLEILFTKYQVINRIYEDQWYRLIDSREFIAHMNPYRAVKSMKGIAMEKFHAMEHPYPSKLQLIQEKGYDGKQVSHLLRVEDYLRRYIAGESYEDCLRPSADIRDTIMAYKRQEIPLETARVEASRSIERVTAMADDFCARTKDWEEPWVRALLDDVCYEIIKISIQEELK